MDNEELETGKDRQRPRKKKTDGAFRCEQPPDLDQEDEEIFDRIFAEERERDAERLDLYTPVWAALVKNLKAIDAEASPLEDGTPIGLWWYAHHLRRSEHNPKNCRNEEAWSRRLRQLLAAQGIESSTEQRYPAPPRRRCDLVIRWPDCGRLWLEVKGAWKHNNSAGTENNGSYPKHLQAAGDDLNKVCTLDGRTADHIGLLLVGFDTIDDPILSDEIDVVRSRPKRAGWFEQYCEWKDDFRRRGRIRVWLWLIEADYVRDIFDG